VTITRLGFAYNPTSEDASELRERAAGWCRMRGVEHWAAPAGETATLVEHLPGTDVLVVLGGDGTFLRAAQAVTEVDVPLLGINLGKVGFLSKAEAHELEAVLGQLEAGTFVVRGRMGLVAAILPAGRPVDTRFTALNDIVVARGSLARVVRLDVTIDESHLATFVADGLVVASPTGSTG
jgi:NAD+ kinase